MAAVVRRINIKIPTLTEWGQMSKVKHLANSRNTLASVQLAEKALADLNIPNPERMTAVEIYPGLGAWSAALVNGGFKRVIALETNPKYAKWMGEIAAQSNGVLDLVKMDGYNWETYIELRKPEYLGNLATEDWSEVNPNILFTGTIPKSTKGEQLLAQFTTCIVNKMAMHTNGRVQMAFWMSEQVYTKFSAPAGTLARCKMSIVTEACADFRTVAVAKARDMYPHTEYRLVHIVPFKEKKITAQWDVFEYVLKHLFVMPKHPLTKMIKTLGPGAEILLKRLSFDPNIDVGDMSVEQINEVAVKFDQWPLRPRVLFEYDID